MEWPPGAGGDWAPPFFLPSGALPDIRCGRFQANRPVSGQTSRCLRKRFEVVRRNSSVGRARHS
jgi:hypothetical protein